MKGQLDIFGVEEPPAGKGKKQKAAKKDAPVKKAKGPRRRREAKKARMLVDSYDAAISMKPVAATVDADVAREPVAQPRKPHIFTVTELTERIKDVLEGGYPDVWISGEVTDFKGRSGPHYYFSLKDEKKNKIRIVIFGAGSKGLPFELKDGLEVILHGRLNVYGPSGYYSIVADHIEPKGIGALQLAFEQLKAKLEKEGLFRPERKRRIPYLPHRIGVVTSPTGAAIRDMIHVLTRRFPNIEILLYPVRVQGEGAAEDISRAIGFLNERSDLDVLIVGRGGGSIEDLWAFNEEPVARAIAASRIPVISAVGHEIDFTISDFVADLRAPTPSAAAEMAVPVKSELLSRIEERQRQLGFALRQGLDRRRQELHKLSARMKDPSRRFPDLLRGVDGFRQRLMFAMTAGIDRRAQMLSKFASNMEHLSPLGILAKGYAVVTDAKGHAVKSSKSLKIDDSLRVKFSRGSAQTKVVKTFDE